MRKLITAFKISLDGKTEGSEGMADWAQSWSEDYGLTSQIDACILGGGMYPGYENYWTGLRNHPDRPAWITGNPPTRGELEWADVSTRLPHHVLSRSLTSAQWPNTSFLRSIDEVAELKQQPGKDIYLMGGAKVASSLFDAGLVDEIRLLVHPLVAGEGSPLFTSNVGRRGLELREVNQLPKGLVSMVYGVASDAGSAA